VWSLILIVMVPRLRGIFHSIKVAQFYATQHEHKRIELNLSVYYIRQCLLCSPGGSEPGTGKLVSQKRLLTYTTSNHYL